jgi:hypothetical protein
MGGLMRLIYYGSYDIGVPITEFQNVVVNKEPKYLYEIKLLDLNESYECPITYIELHMNCKYISCLTCNKYFHESIYHNWIIKKYTCPHCRAEWNNNIIYINRKPLLLNEKLNKETGDILYQ